jgi:hypothetical protein
MASAGVEISAAAIHQIIDTSEISEIQINGTTVVSWLVKLIGNVSSSKPQRCNGLAGAQLATQDPVYATTIDLMALRKSGSPRVQANQIIFLEYLRQAACSACKHGVLFHFTRYWECPNLRFFRASPFGYGLGPPDQLNL